MIKRLTDSTTSGQTDTTSGQTNTTSGQTSTTCRQTSATSGQTNTTSGKTSTKSWKMNSSSGRRVLQVTRQVIPNLMNTTSNIYLFVWTWRCVELMKRFISFSVNWYIWLIKSKSPPIKLMLTAGQIFVKESEELTLVK